MKATEVYTEWKKSVKGPEATLFYNFRSLERIVLGLAIYDIASYPYVRESSKIYVLKLYNQLIDEMVCAWINQTDDFERPFKELMDKTNAIGYGCRTLSIEHPQLKEILRIINNTFLFWICAANSIDDALVDELLADIKVCGSKFYSDKINNLLNQHQLSVANKPQMTGEAVLELLSKF